MDYEEVTVVAKRWLRLAFNGAAAGAAGTTALNAVTYLDMAIRGRPESSTPYRTVEWLADRLGISIRDGGRGQSNRVSALGALGGLVTGVVVGMGLAITRIALPHPGPVKGGLITAAAAMAGANGPMIAMRITDPREWSTADWLADVIPHLAYGMVTAWVLDHLDS